MIVRAYVDGFNLYYGLLRDSRLRWLDLNRLIQTVAKLKTIDKIYYFTARIAQREDDPAKPMRQEAYFRALATLPNVEIVFGHFLSHAVRMPKVNQRGRLTGETARVLKTEEKGSDVNLASYLLRDAFSDVFDQAIVVSNDSDLVTPLRMVCEDVQKPVLILNPHNRPSNELRRVATRMQKIRVGPASVSQFPAELKDARGIIRRPKTWN